MPRRTRLMALAFLQVSLLAAGVGVATAHDGSARPAAPPVALPAVTATSLVPAPRPVVKLAKPKPRKTAKPRPAASHRPTPRATHRAATHPKPRPTATPKAKATAAPTHAVHRTLTAQERLMRVVAKIPGYRTGEAQWIIKRDLASWGLSVMGGSTVYISPSVPADRLFDVVAHEWSHLLVVKIYDNDVTKALAAIDPWFGGGLMARERAADCMAKVLGADWTNYTSCTDAHWREGARRLVSRQRL